MRPFRLQLLLRCRSNLLRSSKLLSLSPNRLSLSSHSKLSSNLLLHSNHSSTPIEVGRSKYDLIHLLKHSRQ